MILNVLFNLGTTYSTMRSACSIQCIECNKYEVKSPPFGTQYFYTVRSTQIGRYVTVDILIENLKLWSRLKTN